jgi:voltage-gated potassium channel Kch
MRPLFRAIGSVGAREAFAAAALLTVLGAAFVMATLGLSMALGAFVAGVMLAESPYRHELEADVEPFRSILLGLFFLSVGMLLDLHLIADRPFFVVGIAAGIILIKAIIIALIDRFFGSRLGNSMRLGLLLSQAGEFGFVLFAQAAAARIITPEAASLLGAVVTLSMATTPFLMRLNDRLEAREAQRAKKLEGPEASPDTPVIVVGYGRFGQTVAQMLMAKHVPVTIVDTDAEMIEVAGTFGTKVYFGDGTRLDLLRTAGADQASSILFCNDNLSGSLTREAVTAVMEAFPQARIMVRTFDRRHMIELSGLDLTYTQRELFESAVKMGRAALRAAGIEGKEIDRVDREYRLRDSERLERQAETGDLRAGLERSFAPDRGLEDESPEPA